jgi:hypothetical protein
MKKHLSFVAFALCSATGFAQQSNETMTLHCQIDAARRSPQSEAMFTVNYANRTVNGMPADIDENRIIWRMVVPKKSGGGTNEWVNQINRLSGFLVIQEVNDPVLRMQGQCAIAQQRKF